jgi:hypothetical protein
MGPCFDYFGCYHLCHYLGGDVQAFMKRKELTVADIGLIASTRAMLGAGIGLLLSDKLEREQRRAVGWTLLLVGFITTFPLVMNVFGQRPASLPQGTGNA